MSRATRRNILASIFLFAAVASDAATGSGVAPEAEQTAILQVMSDMQAAWNRGDFRSYMQGFRYPDVVLVTNGHFQESWQGALDRYIRELGDSAEARGTLRYSEYRLEMLSADAAQLVARYQIVRPQHPQYGVSTRVFRKIEGGHWVITLSHDSATEIPPTAVIKTNH